MSKEEKWYITKSKFFFLKTKSDKTKVIVFYTTLDKQINDIDSRFNPVSLKIINSIGNTVKMNHINV